MTDTQAPLPHACEEDEISLLDILVTLAESWKLLVFGPLVVGVLAGGLSFLWPNTYESVAIVRLTEEDAALIHAAPVLDPLITKFDLLKEADGFQEDARKDLRKKLVITIDKKTKLATLTAKARTPEQAQALGAAAIEAVLQELRVKGKEKEALLKTIAINQQAIGVAEDALESVQKSLKRGAIADLQQESAIKNLTLLNAEIATKTQANFDLALKLEARGEEVYVQKASFPERKSAPKRSLVVIIAVLISGFSLLLWVFLTNAWQKAITEIESIEKINRLKAALRLRA